MRTRLVAAVAVLAAVFLAVSSALAVVPPPVVAVTSPTNAPALSWTDVGSELGYRVFRADSDCSGSPVFQQVGADLGADVLGVPDSTLTTDGTYCYFVRSFDADGESADSNHVQVSYDTAVPTTPGTPTGSTPVASGPSIGFAPSTDADSGIARYDVYRDGVKVNVAGIAAGGPYTWTDVAGQSTSPVSVSGSYSYRVRAVDGAGNFAESAAHVMVFDVDAPTTPGTPTGSTPVASAPAIGFAPSTDADSGIARYDVYRDGVKVNVAGIAAGGPYTWTDDALQSSSPVVASGSYSYTVVAIDAVGNQSVPSAAHVIVYDTAAPTTPGTPTGSTPVASAPVIGFMPSTDADSGIARYDVYRDGVKVNVAGIAPGGPYTWTDVAGQSSSPVSLSGSYSYRVRAVDGAGNFSQSAAYVILFDVDAPATPATPTGSTPVASAPVLNFAPSTDAHSGIARYDVYRDGVKVNLAPIPAGGPYTWSDVAGQSSSPVSLSDSYGYRVRAVDGAGNFSQSAAHVIMYDTAPPTAPGAPTGSTPVSSAPAISFVPSTDADSGIAHYDVYRDGVKVNVAGIAAGGPYTWTDVAGQSSSPVSLSGSYSYRVRAIDVAGNFAQSAPRVILFDVAAPTTPGTPTGSTPVSSAPAIGFAPSTDAHSGIARYDVYRNGVKVNVAAIPAGGPYSWTDVAGQSSSPVVVSGSYSYTVVAVDAVGNQSAPSPARVILMDTVAPTTPAAPTGLSPVSAAPTVSFTATTDPGGAQASGVDHYDVYRDGTKVNVSAISAVGPFTWSDVAGQSSSPASGTQTFSYTVKAVDGAGNVSAASGARLIVLDPTAVSAPTSVTAPATPTNQRPQVSWVAPATPPFAVDHYNVHRNSGGSPVGAVQAPGTTFTDTSANLPDGSYTYQIVAAASDGTTVGVASGAVTVVYDTTAPSVPGGVVGSPALDGSIDISWVAASDGSGAGIARYVVRRSLTATPPASSADGDAICQTVATSCLDAAALNGKLYTYAVFAVDRAGNTSLAGNSAGVTARDQLGPAAPRGLTASPGDGSVDLQWAVAGSDDDVAGYVLVAKPGGQAPTSDTDGTRVCTAILAASTACTASGLTNGATYTFGLFALDEALNRSQAAVVSAAPNGKVADSRAPAAVAKLWAAASGRKVTLTWKNPSDPDFDHVEITAGERKPAALKASRRVYSGHGTKATTTLSPGQSRWFTVVAYDLAGNSSPAASVHVAIAALSKFGPVPRARVHGKVRLSWPRAKGARYYNVQVYAGKKRILVSWPSGRALQLPRAKLKRGTTYTWYVWPGLGAKAKAHYGKLIGKNVFTFTG